MPNESAKIILAVTHAKLSKVRDALAVEGTINALQVGFQFRTPDWDNTTKTVVFVRGRATPSTTNADTTYRILNENNECDVPPEMLAQNGMFSVGVFGVRDNYRIVSNWMCYRITDGCYADGSTPIDPSLTIYEQIISMINNKSSIGHNHDERYYTKDESNDKFLTEEDLPRIPVTSVNQKIGDVVLSAEDVGAFANTVDEQGNQVQTIPYAAIKDRPFYEDALIDITWDGDTAGKASVSNVLYLVSSETPSVGDLIGCTVTVHTDSGEEHSEVITETMISQPTDNVIEIVDTIFVALEDGAVYDTIVFPTKGTYFPKHGNLYIVSLFKGTLKKLDPKFIDMDSLPKEVLKITVTYNSSTDTYSNADKSSDDIESCLNNGGIPYIALYGITSVPNDYIILTYVGYGGMPKRHTFANEGEGIGLYISGLSVSSGSSSQSLKGRINYLEDNTVKTVSQVLTDKQKAQARENIEACDRTHRYEIVESLSNIDNNIDLLDASSEYSTIGSIIQLKALAKIFMKNLIYTLTYGHAETYDSVLSVNTYDNNLNSDATYEYSTSDTGYSTISAIDVNNYKCTLKIRNVDCFEVYFIANTSTLTEEYSSSFSATGVYLKYLATPSYASQYLRIKFKVLQYYKLSDHYLDSTVERTKNKVTAISDSVTDDQYPSALSVKTELDKTVKITEQTLTDGEKAQVRTNIGAGVPQVQSDYTQNDSTKPDYVKNRPCYEDVSINITWDGDTTDRIAASDSDYLVSYDTPSSEDLIGASYTSYNYGERTFVLTADSITYPVENLICVSGVVFIALDNNVTYEEKTFPAKGTYFHKTSLYRSISLYKGTLKKLDPKFIDTDSLPKELLKVTVLYDASTGYSADKTYLDISNCLENGGIPYIALYKGVSTSGMYEIITYCGLSGQGYVFINADSGNVLIVKNNNIVLLVSSNLKLELDKTVKTESQTLSESQKDQARANIGAAETAFGITGASVGQIIKIKAIDDSGVPTGWEVCNSETWTFTLDDGSTVTKEVYVR